MSFAEAKYVSLFACCAQVLWLRTQLTDYGFHFDKIPMYCDSKAAIAISCNPVQHSSTKHIDFKYHFIKEKVEKGIVELFFVGTEYQIADLFTKAMPEERFKYLVRRLGMVNLTIFIRRSYALSWKPCQGDSLNLPDHRDGENLDKMKEKGDECIFVGYFTQSKAYRVFNKRTRVIMESIHVNFDEWPLMASDQNSSNPAPECQTVALNHDSLSPVIQCQGKVTQADRTVTTSNELDLLFSSMFDELLNGSFKVVSKSSAVSAADALNQRQQLTTPLTNHITPAPTCQILTFAPTVISPENINQAETYAENDQVADDEFINIFSNPVQAQGETSSRHVDS
nr:retrovirus-related Pol polyprotein from transposon TNT 1-94 [Tanacetum cinerariifolium]